MNLWRLSRRQRCWTGGHSALAVVLVVGAVVARLLPHPPNVAPVVAIAIFGAATFGNCVLAFLVPLGSMALSDALLSAFVYHDPLVSPLRAAVYGSLALTTLIGFRLRERASVLGLTGASIASSLLFYGVTNFAVWAWSDGHSYPLTPAGLETCYLLALPFLRNALLGDLFWTGVLFGAYAVLKERPLPRWIRGASIQVK